MLIRRRFDWLERITSRYTSATIVVHGSVSNVVTQTRGGSALAGLRIFVVLGESRKDKEIGPQQRADVVTFQQFVDD